MPRAHKSRARSPITKGSESVAPRSVRVAGDGAGRKSTNGSKPKVDSGSDVMARKRAAYRVHPEQVVVRTDPATLPESPRESHGLFELVPTVARRALELGLSVRAWSR